MRTVVIDELERLAGQDDRISIMTADLGYGVMESFAAKFPDRFFNVGISEQLMASAAAGMALCGRVVCMYSIGNFVTLRCIEQIRNDICYHNANVKIIAVGGGVSYGQLGMSHHATEDIAMMRALPNMKVFVPADPDEARKVTRYALNVDCPCYIRLARRGEPTLYPKGQVSDITKIQLVVPGTDAALVACGPILNEAIKAAERLLSNHISTAVFSVPCVKPLDSRTIKQIAEKFSLLISMEEHQTVGGLGSAIAEEVSTMGCVHGRLHCLGLPNEYVSMVGCHDYLCKHYGLNADAVAETVSNLLS